MGGGVIMATTHLNLHSITGFIHHYKIHNPSFARTKIGIQCSTPTHDLSIVTGKFQKFSGLVGTLLHFFCYTCLLFLFLSARLSLWVNSLDKGRG